MAILPIEDVTLPAVAARFTNGRIPGSALVTVPCLYGGANVRLCEPAARAWRAMRAAAARAGHKLKVTSGGDSYRSYDQQRSLFLSRYTTTPNGRYSVTWAGQRWYLLPGMAIAAVPGTSNHGRAIALDLGEERDHDAAAEPVDDPTLNWLITHAHEYGFSAELQSEPWHWRYVAGDTIPAAVLAHERGSANMPARFTFQGFPDEAAYGPATPGGRSRTHITDGVRYLVQQYSSTADKIKSSAGFGPIVNLTPANTGYETYAIAVRVYCGHPDPGELAGDVVVNLGDVVDQVEDAIADGLERGAAAVRAGD